jgi:hypothetical protein
MAGGHSWTKICNMQVEHADAYFSPFGGQRLRILIYTPVEQTDIATNEKPKSFYKRV